MRDYATVQSIPLRSIPLWTVLGMSSITDDEGVEYSADNAHHALLLTKSGNTPSGEKIECKQLNLHITSYCNESPMRSRMVAFISHLLLSLNEHGPGGIDGLASWPQLCGPP